MKQKNYAASNLIQIKTCFIFEKENNSNCTILSSGSVGAGGWLGYSPPYFLTENAVFINIRTPTFFAENVVILILQPPSLNIKTLLRP